MKKLMYIAAALALMILPACNPQPSIDDVTMLDGNQFNDPSLTHPEKYLVSAYMPTPTDVQKNTPVIIAAHGYSATTFEWDELRKYADEKGTFYVSQVLLGGHGRDYTDFKAATWDEWQSSIREEYKKLNDLGFTKIYLAGSSTGCPLIVQMVKAGYFADKTKPKGIFLIDPIVVSSNKQLTMVNALGPILGYTSITMEPGEMGKWYTYRPQESLKQLMLIIDKTRLDLEYTITLPVGTYMKIYKSKIDATADPVSAVMLYDGMRTAAGGKVDIEMVNSDLHVFTRLAGRVGVKASDVVNQQDAFAQFEQYMTTH